MVVAQSALVFAGHVSGDQTILAAMLAESEELRRKDCQSNMRRPRRRGRGRASARDIFPLPLRGARGGNRGKG